MVLFISSNSNSTASNFFYVYSTPFIAWDNYGAGGDFASASGFPDANLFCNTQLKS